MAWSAYLTGAIRRVDSAVESRRFGVSIDRVTVPAGAVDSLGTADDVSELVRSSQADVVVVRYPSGDVRVPAAIAAVDRDVVACGGLAYWEITAGALAAGRGEVPGLETLVGSDLASSADLRRAVTAVVRDSFAGYANHYAVNPLLDGRAALEGYLDWAIGAAEADPDRAVLLRQGAETVGVATWTADAGDLEVELAGLVARAQGAGRYAALLAAVGTSATRHGLDRVIISTQTHNVRAQRAWARLGFQPFGCIETVHCVTRGLLPGPGSWRA